jgi:hypothetical protein
MRTLVAALIAAAGIAGTATLIADSATPTLTAFVDTGSSVEQGYATRRGSRTDVRTIEGHETDVSGDWNRRGMRVDTVQEQSSMIWTSGDWNRRGARDA